MRMRKWRYGLMVDCATDLRPRWESLVSAVGGVPDVVARYLGRGGADVEPLTTDEINWYVAQGSLVLPIFNDSVLNGGTTASLDVGTADAAKLLAQADIVGVPDNCYVASDYEGSGKCVLSADYLIAFTAIIRGSRLAGSGIAYGNTSRAYFREAYVQALSRSQDVQRLLLWDAAWNVAPFTLQDVAEGKVKWDAADYSPNVVAWQACNDSTLNVDLSLIRLPLPQPGKLCGE